jgi:Zn-dependent protease
MKTSGLRIAKIMGIDVYVDWSWTFIAALMTVNVTTAFMRWHPTWSIALSLSLGVLAMLAFFASLLAHEFAHAIVAKSQGMVVRNIRLFLFGGVSNIEDEPPTALGEIGMAIVGPVLSIGIGIALLTVSSALIPHGVAIDDSFFGRLGPVASIVLWLGAINVGVGAFNLVPAFPLDGGRVLRGLLWLITRNMERATRIATRISETIGGSFIVVGVVGFFGIHIVPFAQGGVDGFWLVLIGWFIGSSARSSYAALRARSVFQGLTVGRVMRTVRAAVTPTSSVQSFVEGSLLQRGEHASAVVDTNGALVGIVSATDVAKIARDAWSTTAVSTIMTPIEALAYASPSDPIEAAMLKLSERGVEQLPVLSRGDLVGMLDRRQLSQWLSVWLPRAA